MRVLGVDLAADPSNTAAVMVAPGVGERWQAVEVEGSLDDDRLVSAVAGVDLVGVDSPLGWPAEFVKAVSAHASFRRWPGTVDRSELTHRETDRAVRQATARSPLSVSADRLGSVAMRCALLQRLWAEQVWGGPAPRDGSGRLVETYPAAALHAWAVECRRYKSRRHPAEAQAVRHRMVGAISDAVSPWLAVDPVGQRCIDSDHVLDALVCAFVAIAAKKSATKKPTASQLAAAQAEGWIHVPSIPLAALRP